MSFAVGAAGYLARSPQGRKLLITLVAALAAALLFVALFLTSAVGAVIGQCTRVAHSVTGTPTGGATPVGYVSEKPSQTAIADIPANYLKAYQQAGQKYGIDWSILAGIGRVETNHGEGGHPEDCISSSAGAEGPMQFMPGTWSTEGVDGNGDGKRDICNYQDAIFTAAHYLVDSGAPQDYHQAILAYNHAEWYYNEVMKYAGQYRSAATSSTPRQAALASPAQASQGGGSTPASSAAASGSYSGGGTGAPPQGWDLVDSRRQVRYRLHTRYASYFRKAAAEWNAVGAVKFLPATPSSGTDLVVTDGSESGTMAQTYSDGRMVVDRTNMARATDDARLATFAHEDGHALGFPHTTAPSVMDTPIVYNATNNHSKPTPYDISLEKRVWGVPGSKTATGGAHSGSSVQGNHKAVFPLPPKYFDSYSDTWGAYRPHNGAGGVHEGTDLMAEKGTPIYSITSGTVEPVAGSNGDGWNELGGWAVMVKSDYATGPIRKGDELYYAHMLKLEVHPGEHVEAGEIIGHVGDSGQGPEGTTGQFPPHLHLGWYDPTGVRAQSSDDAMNPYPLLNWLKQNGGTVTGGGTFELTTSSPAPLPAYCRPLQAAGLLPGISTKSAGGNGGTYSSGGGEGGAIPTSAPPDATATEQRVVKEATKWVGTPYVWGGGSYDGPSGTGSTDGRGPGFDCSGLMQYAFYQGAGIKLPRTAQEQYDYTRGSQVGDGSTSPAQMQPGDMLFYGAPGAIHHVAMYIGHGDIVEAPEPTEDVHVVPFYRADLLAVTRPLRSGK